ncbi:hypothetical protein [Beijerinckia sp. L45]|uniref:hypothetical protein n=1 Tax=Beijerinckia sp. L45 TaxID=1641855 RepID=UPI00131C3218|nr:hypothetical protein [Beijerinckia sp. L45]
MKNATPIAWKRRRPVPEAQREEAWQPPPESRFRPSIKSLGLSDLTWLSAVAWICTRNQKLVANYHTYLRDDEPTFKAACDELDYRLAKWRRGGAPVPNRKQAERDLSEIMADGLVKSQAMSGITENLCDIAPDEWLFLEQSKSGAHDAIRNWDQERELYGLIIDQELLLARWQEWPSSLLMIIGRDTWSLRETLYWVKHRSHSGYHPGWKAQLARSAMEELRVVLRGGRLVCEAALDLERPAVTRNDVVMQKRLKPFWIRFGISDVTEARFTKTDVLNVWPQRPDLSGFDNQKAAREYLKEKFGFGTNEAIRAVKAAKVPLGKRGPKPN